MDKKNKKVEKKPDVKKVEAVKKESSFKKKKKVKRNITSGIAYVYSTFNNTIISIADESGNVIAWSSAGAKGFKGSRKSTPYAAQVAADDAGGKAYEQGLRTLTVEVKGPGSGRETALRAFQSKGFKIISKDFERPWGGFLVIEESQAQDFSNQFFKGIDVDSLKISEKLSPKILIVKPKARLSWQYHHRRAEI